jgi:hypothetical protein
LYERFAIGQWLVQTYPFEALTPYSDECGITPEWFVAWEKEELDISPEMMPFTGFLLIQ